MATRILIAESKSHLGDSKTHEKKIKEVVGNELSLGGMVESSSTSAIILSDGEILRITTINFSYKPI